MFKILQKTVSTGIVTINYPAEPAKISEHSRGRPSFDFDKWKDARPAAEVCPTGAISLSDKGDSRKVTVDYGLCVFCGLCAEASSDQAVCITKEFELATADRRNLILTAEYTLNADRTHRRLRKVDRQLLNAESGHADMLLVTGPVTRNMELALLKTYRAMAQPKVVVAVGACGISGGIFGQNYASLGSVDKVLPVDVYIPGCPPRPQALLHGILLAVGRLAERLHNDRAG